MNVTCPRCRSANPPSARLCISCRMPLAAATSLSQPTVLSSTRSSTPLAAAAAAALPRMDEQSIRQRITQLCTSMPHGLAHCGQVPNQLELTCLLLDISTSMKEQFAGNTNKLAAATDAALTMVREKRRIDGNDEMAIVSFSDSATLVQHMCRIRDHLSQIESSINALTIDGGTNLKSGFSAAENALDCTRSGAVLRIVALTDGNDGGDPTRLATKLKSRGVVIDCIGIGPDPSAVNEELLRRVASVIQGRVRYRFIRDSQTLVQHYTVLAGKTAVV